MLRELHVKNLAVLAEASVELGPGLNVLTGETGAGKSIVVDSLLLLSGARASSDLVRTDTAALTVTGVFEPEGDAWRGVLAEAGIDGDGGELMVRREVSREGKNRVYLNDQPATARLLLELSPFLLRIHGQREELGLIDPELQRVWLDQSGGPAAAALLAATTAAYGHWHALHQRLERSRGDERTRRERLEYLRFTAQEIDAARLVADEEAALRGERDALRYRAEITRALGESFGLLFDDEGAAVERLARSHGLLGGIATWEPAAVAWCGELEELRVRLAEVATGLRARLSALEADPARLDQLEDRLALLERLCRKHGAGTAEILERRRAMEEEITELDEAESGRGDLEARTAKALSRYREAALELSAARRRWAAELVERMGAELAELGLGKARLEVRLEPPPEEREPAPAPHGLDRVGFLFAANPGEEARPLARVASGGELSRLYLALQLAARGEDVATGVPTLVFDEADAGISGAQAAALGRKLQRLARGAQILAVTHLPQVASCADHHFLVQKEVRGGRTHTSVDRLSEEQRVEEIARLLAGEKVTELSRSHARELLGGSRAPLGEGGKKGR